MIINASAVDAFLAKKGLTPRVSDADWEIVVQRIAELFGRELWHRCRLIHQAEDAWRRFRTDFPDAIPQPCRFIYCLEFIAFGSPQLTELQEWLTERGIVWRERRQRDGDTEQEEVCGLQIFGFDPEPLTAQ